MDYDMRGEGQSVLLPDGWQKVLVVDCKIETSKNGNEMYVITTDHPETGSTDITYAVTKKGKRWLLKSFLGACGFQKDEKGIYKDVTPEACIGITVEAQNKAEDNEFTTRDGETIVEKRNKFVLFRASKEKATL
jgi:hypothetical protein